MGLDGKTPGRIRERFPSWNCSGVGPAISSERTRIKIITFLPMSQNYRTAIHPARSVVLSMLKTLASPKRSVSSLSASRIQYTSASDFFHVTELVSTLNNHWNRPLVLLDICPEILHYAHLPPFVQVQFIYIIW